MVGSVFLENNNSQFILVFKSLFITFLKHFQQAVFLRLNHELNKTTSKNEDGRKTIRKIIISNDLIISRGTR